MHVSLAEAILIVLATAQLAYAALDYRNRAAAMQPDQTPSRRHPTLVIGLFMLLTWAAVGLDIYDRHNADPKPGDLITGVGSTPPHTYLMGVNTAPLLKYKEDYKLLLITRVVFTDRDRMTDKAIDKSSLYTITGDAFTIASSGAAGLHFAPSQINILEFNLAMIPSKIAPESITSLSDVERFGGRIWGLQTQSAPAGPAASSDAPPQTKTLESK